MTDSTLAHVVEMQLYRAVDADDGARCRQLLCENLMSLDKKYALVQRAVRQARPKALEVLLDRVRICGEVYLRHCLDANLEDAQPTTLVVLLHFCAKHNPMVDGRACWVFGAYVRRISVSLFTTCNHATMAQCAALILVDAGRPDDILRLLADREADVVRTAKYNSQPVSRVRSDALHSIASEPMLMWAAFALMRTRATEICIAMQDLGLPAPCTIEILEAACYPAGAHPKLYDVWRLVTAVKHFSR